jgi:hypothetical protein
MKTIITILFLFLSIRIAAPPVKELMIISDKPINPYEAGFRATCQVETGDNLFAFCEVENAHSIVQIREIRLRDYNNRTRSHYTILDLYDYRVSRKIYMYYASQIDYHNQERIAREWNGWRNGMKKESTREYWRRIRDQLLTNKN